MKTTTELLEEARENLAREGLTPTWYRLALELDISHAQLFDYRRGRSHCPDEIIIKTSRFLDYPPEVLLVWNRMEREKNPVVLNLWQRMEERLSPA